MLHNLSLESNEHFKVLLGKLENNFFHEKSAIIRHLIPNENIVTSEQEFIFGQISLGLSWGRSFIEDINGNDIFRFSSYDLRYFEIRDNQCLIFEFSTKIERIEIYFI